MKKETIPQDILDDANRLYPSGLNGPFVLHNNMVAEQIRNGYIAGRMDQLAKQLPVSDKPTYDGDRCMADRDAQAIKWSPENQNHQRGFCGGWDAAIQWLSTHIKLPTAKAVPVSESVEEAAKVYLVNNSDARGKQYADKAFISGALWANQQAQGYTPADWVTTIGGDYASGIGYTRQIRIVGTNDLHVGTGWWLKEHVRPATQEEIDAAIKREVGEDDNEKPSAPIQANFVESFDEWRRGNVREGRTKQEAVVEYIQYYNAATNFVPSAPTQVGGWQDSDMCEFAGGKYYQFTTQKLLLEYRKTHQPISDKRIEEMREWIIGRINVENMMKKEGKTSYNEHYLTVLQTFLMQFNQLFPPTKIEPTDTN